MKYFCKPLFFLLFFVLYSFHSSGQNPDIDLLREINLNRNTDIDPQMKAISKTEAVIGIGLPIGIVAASYINRDEKLFEKGVNMSLAIAASSVTTFLMKRLINRPRPSTRYPDIQAFDYDRYYSFPSGHTSNAFCTATSLSLNFKKWYFVLPAYAWATTVAYSRMHMGMHYPSDVLMGAFVGAGAAYATYRLNKWIKKHYQAKKFWDYL